MIESQIVLIKENKKCKISFHDLWIKNPINILKWLIIKLTHF